MRWVAPSPLWDDLTPLGSGRFRAPALLRFANDTFMDELHDMLASRPDRLRGFVARPETWRRPAVGLTASVQPGLKLYQPVHGRFYLVTASLSCRVPGLPEHTVDFADGESVSFVLRRVTDAGEQAWVAAADGVHGWAPASAVALAPGEELLPMFATSFAADDLTRRVFAGLVPVGRREAYVGGRAVAVDDAVSSTNGAAAITTAAADAVGLEEPRVLEFQRAVQEPWVELRAWYRQEPEVASPERRDAANDAAEQGSALILLDFARYLEAELPAVWKVVRLQASANTLSPAQKALHDGINFSLCTRTGAPVVPMFEALRDAYDHAAAIEGAALVAPADEDGAGTLPALPGGLTGELLIGRPFPDPATPEAANAETGVAGLLARDGSAPQEAPGVHVRKLKHLVMRALAEVPVAVTDSAAADSALPGAAPGAGARPPLLAPLNAQGDDRFVIRCVYQRPRCGRGYGPLLSDATQSFQLASFFDPDAPQRPIRVALPVDTSPAGLRKFDKSVGFVLSNELRKQMSRVKGMKELIDGDIDNPRGLDISVICSLSIPIITICALILLMIIVSLLNFIFWWIPFFKICFPVPSLKAKP